MIKFKRYPHVADLLEYYLSRFSRSDIKMLLANGIENPEDAQRFSEFIWLVAGQTNEGMENNIEVLGSTDNSEMIPDLSYEITEYMKQIGYYHIWEEVSDSEME